MKKKSLTAFNQIEAQRSGIVSLYESLSPEQLKFKPAADHWNLLQVMKHLIIAEEKTLQYIRRKLEHHEKVRKAGFGATIRNLMLKVALALPLKFRAPAVAEVKEEHPDLSEMINEWNGIRKEFGEIIRQNSDEILSKELYLHPRAGKLSVIQALQFTQTHISHHQKQMKRIQDHKEFPG
ncbi:MAG: DinB family protein [Balneolaceae bacterium]|nr:DinB family protein [Balneolaceae bacterium]MCH8549445.1 DinB family protein [Balneolaceae bacterium]